MTDKQVADADKRQAEREAVAAKGKERAEKATAEKDVTSKDADVRTVDDAGFEENPRYGVKVSGENDGR